MADNSKYQAKLEKKSPKMASQFVKDFCKKNKLNKKSSLSFQKGEDGASDKIIVSFNILDIPREKYPNNWKYEKGKLIYSDDKGTIDIKIELKHLEDMKTPNDVLYELELANPDAVFKITDKGIETDRDISELNLDYLKMKGFQFDPELGFVNKDILINGEPLRIGLNKVHDFSASGNSTGEAGDKQLENMTSTAGLNSDNFLRGGATADIFHADGLGGIVGAQVGLENIANTIVRQGGNDGVFDFNRMKETFDRFFCKVINGQLVAVDKKTQEVITDPNRVAQTQMAEVWYRACNTNAMPSTDTEFTDNSAVNLERYENAFGARVLSKVVVFDTMLEIIEQQVEGGHGLDVEQLKHDIESQTGSPESAKIVEALLTNPENVSENSNFPIKSEPCLSRIKQVIAKSLQAKNENFPLMPDGTLPEFVPEMEEDRVMEMKPNNSNNN